MTAAQDLWAAVVARYPASDLISLTNLRDPNASTINTTAGESAAQDAITRWPLDAQVDYDATNALHVAIGVTATLAILFDRGGAATTLVKVEMDKVFAEDGLLGKLRKIGARGRQVPASNSGVTTPAEDRHGAVLGWSDPDALPHGIMPNTRTARGVR